MDTSFETKRTETGDKAGVERHTRAQRRHSATYEIQHGVASLHVHDANHNPETVHDVIRGNARYTFKKPALFTRITKKDLHPLGTGDEKTASHLGYIQQEHVEDIQKSKPIADGKKAWPCACGNPEHEVVARIVEVQYKPPIYTPEHTLRIPASTSLPVGELKYGVEHVKFDTNFVVKDSHLRQIARGQPAFRGSLRALTCGDTKLRTTAPDTFTDRQIVEIARSCPNLRVAHFATPGLQLADTANIDDPNQPSPAFQKLAQYCSSLEALTLAATRAVPGTLEPRVLEALRDRRVCGALRYLEVQNLDVEDEFGLAVLLKNITRGRPELEIAHGWMGVVYLYRGGESYLLERDLEVCPEVWSGSESGGDGDSGSGEDGEGGMSGVEGLESVVEPRKSLGERLFRLF